MKQVETSNKVIDLVNRLSNDGSIDGLLGAALISPKIIGYREMYFRYDINIRVHKMQIMEAQYDVADHFKCSIDSVRRAIKVMSAVLQ